MFWLFSSGLWIYYVYYGSYVGGYPHFLRGYLFHMLNKYYICRWLI